ncbi:TetR family transcriptional regulator [Variovorax sp. LjRoot290]|uniref:TetR/AcrR family transcriptional regulator n=1 Tax=unclassified Variovorax TaxID=663243 RepID=UPI00088F1F74|nr:TetR family transcriptional regulator [Variovorax sp. CF079]SDD82837.1 transcriptional regulator, TetR family [Variovorax sp. CF079]
MTETRSARPGKAGHPSPNTEAPAAEPKRVKSTKGEQSKKLLLDAALVSIAKQGIYSITHRSIAAEAGVPKSLTTYFFSSLPDLLEQAFIHFTVLAADDNVKHLEELDALMASRTTTWPLSPGARRTLHKLLSQRLAEFILRQATEHPVGVAVELNFLYVYRSDKPIRQHIEAYRGMLLNRLANLIRRFSGRNAAIDASLMLGMIHQLLFKSTITPQEIDRERVHAEVSRMMAFILL